MSNPFHQLTVLTVRHSGLIGFLAGRYRSLFGANPRSAKFAHGEGGRPRFRMSTEEIEGIVRALTIVAESLETEVARQSMQDAFMHVRAHALAQRCRGGAVGS